MLVGALLGIVGGMVGFAIYGVYYTSTHPIDFLGFVNKVFIGTPVLRSPILSLSILFNLLPFYLLLNRKYYQGARGVMLSIFLYAILIVYFRFFS
jgi:hypothetical protein